MKKELISIVLASAVLGAASMAYAGAYSQEEQPEEIPAPIPAPPPVIEPEPEPVMRKFEGFLTDAETTRGIWAELSSVYGAEYHPSNVGDVEGVNTVAHLSYGQEMFEVGAMIPYLYVSQETLGPNRDDNDFGDLRLWAKVVPLRKDNFTLGGGLITTFPTGNSGMGTAEYGFEPFLTFGVLAGPASIRGSIGYNVFTSHPNLGDDVYDRTDANLGVLVPCGDRVVVRAELVHNHFVDSDADPVSIIPGADISFPIGEMELLLRPTLGIGLTEAPDWQAGLGIALLVPGV